MGLTTTMKGAATNGVRRRTRVFSSCIITVGIIFIHAIRLGVNTVPKGSEDVVVVVGREENEIESCLRPRRNSDALVKSQLLPPCEFIQ